MAAAIPAIVSAGSALYGAYSANKARQKQDELNKSQQAIQAQVTPQAKNYMNQSQEAIGPALSYYTNNLNNTREATAPEQNRIGALYAGQAAAARNSAPRGYLGAGAAENVRNQQRQATEGVIQNARPAAAGALATMGGNLGQLGMQGYGLGSGILSNVFNQGLAARQQTYQQGMGMGGSLWNAYQYYMLNRANNPGGTTDQTGTAGMYGGMGGASGASGVTTNTGGAGSWGLM
jgi:hypothetical protein